MFVSGMNTENFVFDFISVRWRIYNFVSQFLIVLRIGKLLYDFSLHRWGNALMIVCEMYHEILNWIILNR